MGWRWLLIGNVIGREGIPRIVKSPGAGTDWIAIDLHQCLNQSFETNAKGSPLTPRAISQTRYPCRRRFWWSGCLRLQNPIICILKCGTKSLDKWCSSAALGTKWNRTRVPPPVEKAAEQVAHLGMIYGEWFVELEMAFQFFVISCSAVFLSAGRLEILNNDDRVTVRQAEEGRQFNLISALVCRSFGKRTCLRSNR